MRRDEQLLSQDEAALVAALDRQILSFYAECGLIAPAQGYCEDDLAELRRVRRLADDLGLDHAAIEVVLRMRRRLVDLQAEVHRLRMELRGLRSHARPTMWIDADWTDIG